ncbi:MAG TPA: hypothetical protein VM469_12735 [Pseudoxanthomonas sp.]|jgi:outer membrane receptor for ferrienterochelin and colicin|nr:hypothetical protein [Pseudoxanthomonas sp.]
MHLSASSIQSSISSATRRQIESAVTASEHLYHSPASVARLTQQDIGVVQQVLDSSRCIRMVYLLTPPGVQLYASRKKVSMLANYWLGFKSVQTLKRGAWL